MKHDIKNCTFIIPVRIDSQDRINNLFTSVRYIQKHFNTNILIYEEDKDSKLQNSIHLLGDAKFIFNKSDNQLFYKTKCINNAVKIIETEYFCIYDTDIVLPSEQILETIKKLESGYETVYPYDGRFIMMPKKYTQQIYNNMTLVGINLSECKYGLGMKELSDDRQSFGGCVFFNKESFIRTGMANENIVSYGPEDAEIAYRFRLLTKFYRVFGPLYHMDHVRFINSDDNHPMTEHNHNEFKKIMNMSKNDLVEYIKTWTWKNF